MGEEHKQAVVLFSLIAFVIVALVVLYYFDLLRPVAVLLIILVVLVIMYTRSGTFFVQLQEYERAVVFRYGKFQKVAGPGWLFMIPFIETFRLIDLRVRTVDVGAQEVITKDNIKLHIDAIIYLHVFDAQKAIINVRDYERASVSYIQAHLRDVVGKMTLEYAISRVDEINKILLEGLQKITREWGVNVVNVEIQSLEIPDTVISAMHRRKAAEQDKLAAVEKAEAHKLTIDAIQAAAGKLSSPSLQYLYLQSLQKIAEGKSSKIIFPMELSRIASGLAAKLGEPYEKAQEQVVERYQKGIREGKGPETIVETLRREVGVPAVKAPEKPKRVPKRTHVRRTARTRRTTHTRRVTRHTKGKPKPRKKVEFDFE
jgi:regulator of protease activity HflC (stomatin/prohibitin superfamily)